MGFPGKRFHRETRKPKIENYRARAVKQLHTAIVWG
jgi:hypothetical protein